LNLPQKQYYCSCADHGENGGECCRRKSITRLLAASAVLSAMILCAGTSLSHAQVNDGGMINREYAIKAAYLYQFGYYTEWPAEAFTNDQSPFVIGVLGADPFGTALDDIAREKKIAGRPIVIKRFTSLEDYKPCHILYMASSAVPEGKLSAIQKEQKFPVLIVGETPGFAEQGGAINLFVEQNRVRFEINVAVAKREQLKISSKLLSLAKIVGSTQQK
jgi:hypothetical protein